MSEDIKAFPTYTVKDGIWSMGGGMTLRDYFANSAMESIINKIQLGDSTGRYGIKKDKEEIEEVKLLVAFSAYKYADAMLKARGKE